MKKIIIIFLIIISIPSFSQDPSFSLIDLGSMYMNPSYTGASGHPKFLLIKRNQWQKYNIPSNGEFNGNPGGIRPFVTTLAEFSKGFTVGNGRVGLRTIGIGASFMFEDHLLIPNLLSNTIFLRRHDYQAYLSGLFKIGKTKPFFRRGRKSSVIHYAQPAISYGQSIYGLQTEGIVTSEMLTPYTLSYSGLPDPSINIQDLAINKRPFHKLVIGLLYSAQGNTNSSGYNITESGFAFQRMTEGFNNNPLTSRITLHINHKESLPDWKLKMIPFWNISAKREIYYSGGPFTNKIMGKTEIGGSVEVGRSSLIELGSFIRFTSDYTDEKLDVNWQTISPFIRLNIPGIKHKFQFSYCVDIESTFFTNPENDLYIANTGITNEIGFTIIFWGGKGPKECVKYGIMKQNGLLQDIMKNGF